MQKATISKPAATVNGTGIIELVIRNEYTQKPIKIRLSAQFKQIPSIPYFSASK